MTTWIRCMTLLSALAALTAQAQIPTSPVQLQVPKRFAAELEDQRAKVAHRPFTIADVRTRLPGATLQSVVTLRNGRRVIAKQLLDDVNAVERSLNLSGYTLRGSKVPIAVRTKVQSFIPRLTQLPRSAQAELSETPFTQMPPLEWELVVGDPDQLAVRLENRLSAKNLPVGPGQQQQVRLDISLLGRWLALLDLGNSGDLTHVLGNTCQLQTWLPAHRATADCVGARQTAVAGTWTQSTSFEYTQAIWGPFEVTVRASPTVRFNEAMGTSATLGASQRLDLTLDKSAGIDLRLAVLGGAYLVHAGMAADLRLVDLRFTESSGLLASPTPTREDWRSTTLTWTAGYQGSMESGGGSLSLVLEFDYYFGSREFKWTFATFSPASYPIAATQHGPITANRPAPCAIAGAAGASGVGIACGGTCVDFLNSAEHCGACSQACTQISYTPPIGGTMTFPARCTSGRCLPCAGSCWGKAPGADNGCGSPCATCGDRPLGFLFPYWCSAAGACLANAAACQASTP